MIFGALSVLFLAVFFDSRILHRENDVLFKEHFCVSKTYCLGLSFFLLLILLAIDDRLGALAVFFFIVFLPLYLIRRSKYISKLTLIADDVHLGIDAIGVILYWLFGGIVISIGVSAFFSWVLEFDSELGELMISAGGSSLLLIILVYYASARFSTKGFFHNVGLVSNNCSFLKLFVLPVVVGLIFAFCSAYILLSRETIPQTPLSEIIGDTQSSQMLMIFLGMAICIAPLVEEIVFRGYFYHVLLKLRGFKFTLICISLSFAMLHVGQYWGDWLAIIMITAIGFALTTLRAFSGSTIASTVTHYVYNGAVTIIPIIMILVNNPAYLQYHANYPQLDFREKEALLHEAIENDPRMADLHYELALLYLESNRNIDAAFDTINLALEIFPDERQFLQTKALILERQRRYGKALEIRKKLLKKGSKKKKLKAF